MRQKTLLPWLELATAASLPTRPAFSLHGVLCSDLELHRWHSRGLPLGREAADTVVLCRHSVAPLVAWDPHDLLRRFAGILAQEGVAVVQTATTAEDLVASIVDAVSRDGVLLVDVVDAVETVRKSGSRCLVGSSAWLPVCLISTPIICCAAESVKHSGQEAQQPFNVVRSPPSFFTPRCLGHYFSLSSQLRAAF